MSPTRAMRLLKPLPAHDRSVQIDFLRGVALLGILLVNASFFFHPFARMMESGWVAEESGPNQFAWLFVHSFCAGKFISLFSLMFGFGVAVQMARVAANGSSAWGFGACRFGFLMALGACHALLIWYGDILFLYSILGMVLILIRSFSPRALLICAGILAAVLAMETLVGALFGLLMAMQESGAKEGWGGASAVSSHARGWEALWDAKFLPMHPTFVEAESAAYSEGPWVHAVAFRATSWCFGLLVAPFSYGLQCLMMMCLGMWAYKVEFWSPQRAVLRRRVGLMGVCVGLPIAAAGFAALWATRFQSPAAWTVQGVTMQLSGLVLPLGYAVAFGSAATLLPAFLSHSIAAAGRMALTTYLLESGVATCLSYWWGFRWFGQVSPAQQIVVCLCIWGSLVVLARAWLAFLPMGPMEWLWRACTYRTLRPGRVAAHAAT